MKITRNTELPVFVYEFDDTDLAESFGIALVKQPAIQKTFAAFRRAIGFGTPKTQHELSGSLRPTGQRRILLGALAIPDQNIYRRDSRGEYVVRFTQDNVRKLGEFLTRQLESGTPVRFNLEHKSTVAVEAELKNVFIKQSGDLLDVLGYDDYPEGSLFISVFVPDEQVWERYVLPKKVLGFSLEMFTGLRATNERIPRKSRYEVVPTKLSVIKEDMNTLKRVLSLFAGVKTAEDVARIAKTELEKLAASEMTLADGRTLIVEDDGTVYLRSTGESGEDIVEIAPAGEHALADGTVVRLTYTVEVVEPAVAPDPEDVAAPEVDEVLTLKNEIETLRKQVAELSKPKPAQRAKLAAVPTPSATPNTTGLIVSDYEFLNRNKKNGKNN